VALESLKSDSQANGEKIITLEGKTRSLNDAMNDSEDRLMEISQKLDNLIDTAAVLNAK
jgi:hypothetical protein